MIKLVKFIVFNIKYNYVVNVYVYVVYVVYVVYIIFTNWAGL